MMFVRISGLFGGSFDFDPGECSLDRITRQTVYSPREESFLRIERHDYTGELIPPNGLDQGGAFDWLSARETQVEGALSGAGIAAVALIDSRGLPTRHILGPANPSTQGTPVGFVRVKNFGYGKRDQAEALTGRTFSFSVEQEYRPSGASQLYNYTETITWDGDTGPEFVDVPLDTGEADIQQVRERGIQTIIQQGNAIGIGQYPAAPDAIYPNLPRAAKPVVSQQEPIIRGGVQLLFPISWRYTMMSTVNQF